MSQELITLPGQMHRIVEQLRSIAQDCKSISRDLPDEELLEYLGEIRVTFTSIASALEEYDQ